MGNEKLEETAEKLAVVSTKSPVVEVGFNPMAMVQMALEKDLDADKISKFMDMADRWQETEARKAYVNDMLAFKAEPLVISRTKQVDFTNKKGGRTKYKHAELHNICDAVVPLLIEHGFVHRWTVGQKEDVIAVTCEITHKMGHSERVTISALPDDSGGKNKIQGVGSTVKYLERYTLMAAIGKSDQDDDDGRGAGQPSAKLSEEQIEAYTKEIQATQTVGQAKKVKDVITKACNKAGDVEAFTALKEIYQAHKSFLQGVKSEENKE